MNNFNRNGADMGGAAQEGGKKRAGIIIIAILLIIAMLVAAGIIYALSIGGAYDAGNTARIEVEVPLGSSTDSIAELLEEKGVIRSASQFNLKTRIEGNGGKYRAGTYELSPSMTMEEIMDVMIEGANSNTTRFTAPEGSTLAEIAGIVAATGVCTADEFMTAAAGESFDYDFLSDNPLTGEKRLEGFLYPDTYDIYADEAPESIIERMLRRFGDVYYEAAESAGSGGAAARYNTFQLVTVASLVEKESKLDEERPLIASVVYNRLNVNMKLQFDSTVQYALGTRKSRLYYSDLKVDSPYNTYANAGLPAGPIGSPGRASLEAALTPMDTDYLYFVVSAEGDGSHNFAATVDEFDSYKAEYIDSLAE